MKLAYSTNAFTKTDLHSALKYVAELGYQGVEILCDKPHWFPGEVSQSEVKTVANILSEHGLAISNLNANTANGYYHPIPPENVFEPALCNPEPELRQWRQRYTIEAIRLASLLGAECISITSGHASAGCPPQCSLEYLVGSMMHICEAAEQYNVKVGIEYEPGLLVERATEAREVIDLVKSPYLGVNFDIGHSYIDGENPEESIALLKDRIWNVHVEDIQSRKHFHLVPGDGELPFNRYLNALQSSGYDGFLTVELYTFPDHAVEVGRRSINYLRKLLN